VIMNLSFTIRMALRALRHHKGRSFLTILGIVIGIAGIVAITAIGNGSQKKARDQILAYGSKFVRISVGNFAAKGVTKPPIPFKMSDIDALTSQCNKIQYITPEIESRNIEVMYEGATFSADITGINDHEPDIYDVHLREGIFLNQQHLDRKENVVVIDHVAAKTIFKPWESPLGKTIRLKKIPFTIIGVLKPPKTKGRWDFFEKLEMFIPFTTGQKLFSHNPNEFYTIGLCAYDEKENAEVKRQATRILRALHKLDADTPDDFMVWEAQMMAEAAEAGAKIIALFALIAASIALLVGGIGVMNIMLVAVKERTREIGIKLALGALKHVILRQFLFEAVVLCFVGGVIGVCLGVTISWLLASFTDLPAIIEIMPIIIALLITIFIGLFFGYYPARKASLLDPIEALQEQ
ncbi:MAG: ABC transporter permease, partial [bacterium]